MIPRVLAVALCTLTVLAGCSSEAPPEPKPEAKRPASVAPDEGYTRVDQVIDPVALHNIAWSTAQGFFTPSALEANPYKFQIQTPKTPGDPPIAYYRAGTTILVARWSDVYFLPITGTSQFAGELQSLFPDALVWAASRDRLLLGAILFVTPEQRQVFMIRPGNHGWLYEVLQGLDQRHAAKQAFPQNGKTLFYD